MDRLSEMEAFAAVVDQGGFTGAANKLGISKSAVSKHVSSLETRLGTQLLSRTTRRVNPTAVGLVYYDRARSVLSAAYEADASISAMQAPATGTLKIVASADFGVTLLPKLVQDFLDLHGGVDVRITLTNRYVELISEGYDIALRLGNAPDGALPSRRLDLITRHLVASPAYLAEAGQPERIEDLPQHRLLHFADADADPSWTLVSPTGEERIVRTPGRLIANSGLCLRQGALSGMGIAFLPEFVIAADLAEGRLVPVMAALPTQTMPLYAIYPPNGEALPRVRAFVEFLSQAYAPAPAPARNGQTVDA